MLAFVVVIFIIGGILIGGVGPPQATPMLQSHAFLHASIPASTVNLAAQDSRGPKLERPTITIGICMEDWNIFTHRRRIFINGCGIAETSASAQLFQCASRELGDSLLKSDAIIITLPSADLLTAMQRLANVWSLQDFLAAGFERDILLGTWM